MTWLFGRDPLLRAIKDDLEALRLIYDSHTITLLKITKELRRMSEREDAAYAKLSADIAAVKTGWAALVAENAALKADNQTLRDALAAADATQAAAVEAALTADSAADADKVEAADAALAELVAPPVEPAPEG